MASLEKSTWEQIGWSKRRNKVKDPSEVWTESNKIDGTNRDIGQGNVSLPTPDLSISLESHWDFRLRAVEVCAEKMDHETVKW
ncbi:unnamed protein product, partial [Aphanomyces euteiches]